MKILINIPKIYGGVYNHYWGLYPYWSEDVKYNEIGRRTTLKYSSVIWYPWDIIKFIFKIIVWNPNRILINPSFTDTAMMRDLPFLKIATFFGKNTFVFIHGWHKEYEDILVRKKIGIQLNRSRGIIVLANEFKESLTSMGISVPIHTVTTKVNDRLLDKFDISCRNGKIKTILFLARIEKEKGIFIVIDAFKEIKKKYPELQLKIVGDGTVLNTTKEYVIRNSINDIFFHGQLSGEKLSEEFILSDIYILPSYEEGMPASVLEAMAFGLPVITRPVGGLVDFFTSNMGSLVESLEPNDYIIELEKYIENPSITKSISVYNHQYAKENFLASSVAKKIENILDK